MTDCLDCLDPQNYAAVALKLQETALQAEQCLYHMETELRQVTNPETVVLVTTGATIVTADVFTRIGQGTFTSLFANSPRVNFVVGAPWTPGVWEVGVGLTAVATGAVSVDSHREVYIISRRFGSPYPTIPAVYSAMTTTSEPNDGVGVDMTASATIDLAEGELIEFWFRHGNVASTVSVNAGALLWGTRLSDPIAYRTVS